MIQLRYATIEDAVALAEVESASFPLAEACSLENFKKRLAVFATASLCWKRTVASAASLTAW